MDFNEYQDKAQETLLPQCHNISYTALELAGEAGEVADKVKKVLRGDYRIDRLREIVQDELGDVLYGVATLAMVLDIPLNDIAERNIKKLASRKERGVIQGDGDSR